MRHGRTFASVNGYLIQVNDYGSPDFEVRLLPSATSNAPLQLVSPSQERSLDSKVTGTINRSAGGVYEGSALLLYSLIH